jgi:uncharacterized membrane protein YfcA
MGMIMLIITLALASFVGIALGLLGGGGSILTLPILKYVVGMEAHAAVAASLFVVGATSIAAVIPHARAGRVVWRTGLVFGAASMLGAFIAGSFAKLIPAGVLLTLFALMMVVTAVAMLRGKRTPASAETPSAPTRFGPAAIAKIAVEGLAVGAVTGLVGAGGGFLVVPALVLLGGLPMQAAVGTSLLVIALKSFAGFAGHATQVSLDWPLVLGVTAAALAGSFVGVRAAGRIPAANLRRGFGWFVVVMAVFMLAQEVPPLLGASWPIWVAVVLTLATAAAAVVTERLLSRRLNATPSNAT